jgi:hypothetical protein
MTEAEWLASTDPDRMLAFLTGARNPRKPGVLAWFGWQREKPDPPTIQTASPRKLRLLACACCRRLWPLLYDVRSQQAVEWAERWADGLTSEEDLRDAQEAAREALEHWQGHHPIPSFWGSAFGLSQPGWTARALAARAALEAIGPTPEGAVTAAVRAALEVAAAEDPHWAAASLGAAVRANLLRELFGNPFQEVAVAPTWLTWNDRTVPRLAQAIYEERRFGDLPILADALEEAGCDHADVLAHCRQPGVHVPGCWVVDRLLEKT